MSRKVLIAIAAAGLLAGCSKKTMDQPPPATPPPVETTPAPEPTPPPPPPPAPAPVAEALELQDVFFDYDSAELRSDARATLSENGRLMVSGKGNATIEGHCDERGTVDYNLALGDRRANAAKDFLVSYGVEAGRLRTVSFGENKPMALGHDEASWTQNRRAHFVIE